VAEAVALARQLGEMPTRFHILGIHAGEDVTRLPEIYLSMLTELVQRLLRINRATPSLKTTPNSST
jgi:hypothetical protein